jgi:hypothetical protein
VVRNALKKPNHKITRSRLVLDLSGFVRTHLLRAPARFFEQSFVID